MKKKQIYFSSGGGKFEENDVNHENDGYLFVVR